MTKTIWSFISIKTSRLHLGQKSGKFNNTVSFLALTLVLLLQTGHDTHSSFISIIGIILLVPIFQPEQDDEVKDIVASKYIDSTYVYLIRAAYSVIGIILLVLAFSLFMFACGCEITVKLIVGTIADAIFLGSIGLLTSAV